VCLTKNLNNLMIKNQIEILLKLKKYIFFQEYYILRFMHSTTWISYDIYIIVIIMYFIFYIVSYSFKHIRNHPNTFLLLCG